MFSNAFIGGTNDMEIQAYNMWYLKDSLVNYHKIPSWTSDHFGGKPFLGIYQPLTYFLALPISLIFGGVLTPKFVFLIFSAIAFIGLYFLAKYLFKSRLKALLASLIFIVFPGKLMATSGGTLAQVTAIAFIPFIFLVYEKLIDEPKLRYFALLGLLQGLCLLTHHAVGGTVFISLLILMAYDWIINKKKFVYKLIPFLIIGAIISLVFLIPSYLISNTLNFTVVKNIASEGFRPLSFLRFFSRDGSRGEFIGIIGFVAVLGYLLSLRKKKIKENRIIRYMIISIVLLLIGLILHPLIPSFIKATLERAVRMFSVLSVTLSILIVAGLIEISKYFLILIKKFKLLTIKRKKNINKKIQIAFTIVLAFLIFLSYIKYMPVAGNELQIPSGVVDFYNEIANDKEYYRIEDQKFAPFGFSTIMHKHGIVNGGNYLAAPKYHFNFWGASWSLLQNEIGVYNFAGLYGTLAVKYILTNQRLEGLPYLKKIKEGYGYIIYENENFLDYVRVVPNLLVINIEEPNHISLFFNLITKNIIKFDEVGFAHTTKLENDVDLNRISFEKVELLEREPGYLKIKIDNVRKKTYLIIAESYHPYWQAVQGDNNLEIYEGIPSTLVIPIEENGIVEIKYRPPIIRFILFLISIILSLGLIGLILYDIKKPKVLHI